MSDTLSVLVVDDDFRVAAIHREFVDKVRGFHTVGVAHTAAEARDLGRSLRPDLVLMDIYLPDGDGLGVLRSLLTGPTPPIALVISAANDIDTIRTALRLGAVHYLVKPFPFTALMERLQTIREMQGRLDLLSDGATQRDINDLYASLRPVAAADDSTGALAPTLRLVLDAISHGGELSASEIASEVGISRATAQRCLAQLEVSGFVRLRLRYGATGRPEHRYSLARP